VNKNLLVEQSREAAGIIPCCSAAE